MIILAIETSCDETGISVLRASGGFRKPRFMILSNVVASQVKIHSRWGGVVPNLARREHERNLAPVLAKALEKANLLKVKSTTQNSKLENLKTILKREPELAEKLVAFLEKQREPKIDAVAATVGPGLEPALWVGLNFAKALAMVWNKPLIGINHLEGHLFSVFLKERRKDNFQFPAVALLASGGHTQLILMKDWLDYKIVGETLDDAAGEAFDKVARMLNLGYPGGPQIAQLAQSARKYAEQAQKNAEILPRMSALSPRSSAGKFNKIEFPRPMLNSGDFNFSFSGLKTAVLYKLRNIPTNYDRGYLVYFIAREFQQAVIDVLLAKTIRAAKEYKAKTIILGGGVAANKELRSRMKRTIQKQFPDSQFLMPDSRFCGDNAAMIAAAGYFQALKKNFADLSKLKADGNLKL